MIYEIKKGTIRRKFPIQGNHIDSLNRLTYSRLDCKINKKA